MRVIISPRAEKNLKRLSKIDQIAIARKIRQLRERQVVQEEKLKGFQNIFRVRVGDFRVVFRRTPQEIYIILVGHRKDIYDLFSRLRILRPSMGGDEADKKSSPLPQFKETPPLHGRGGRH